MADIDRVNGRYQARWRDPDGRQRARLFDTKREAQDHLAQVRTEIRRGAYTGDRTGQLTVREYSEQWLPRLRHLRPNSVSVYETALRLHIIPALGSRKIGSIKITDVEYLIAALARKHSPATVRSISAVLHQLLGAAVRESRLASNPCTGTKLPPRQRRPLELLTADQVSALAAAITPGLEVSIWLGCGAGLRLSETLGLIVPRIDFLRRRIRVEEQLQRGQLVEPKTDASRRTVPVDDLVVQKIAGHLEQ
jgi:integrase